VDKFHRIPVVPQIVTAQERQVVPFRELFQKVQSGVDAAFSSRQNTTMAASPVSRFIAQLSSPNHTKSVQPCGKDFFK
jgi:hypothetical protein